MKNILLIALLFIVSFVSGQNKNIISKMIESNTIEDIKAVADDLVSKSKQKYDFYKIASVSRGSEEKYQFVIYTKEGMTADEKKELSSNFYANCIVVKFQEWNKGENKDLEIKGETVYFFKEVTGKYLELFGFWQNTFYPSATPEQLLSNYKMQEYRIDKGLKYKFRKNDSTWTLSKSY